MMTFENGSRNLNIRALAVSMGGSPMPREGRFHSICCPCHSDTRPSAYLFRGRDGRLRAGCFKGCEERKIVAEIAKQFGTTVDNLNDRTTGGTSDADNYSVEEDVRAARSAIERQEKARAIWAQSQPIAPGDLADRYIRGTRGLALPAIPAALRLHSQLRHGWSKTFWPALVAAVQDTEHEIVAVHRTWLDPATADKAPVAPQKASLGQVKGGAVRLIDVAGSNTLLVGEGVETTLAALQLLDWACCGWAAVSAPGMAALVVPPRFRRVIVAADNDSSNAGLKAARVLVHRLQRKGRCVAIRVPARADTDWADVAVAYGRQNTEAVG
jgi:hypothetical protein